MLYSKILESVDIVNVIESYINLKKTGANFKALCPFHKEDTPSFIVSRNKQIYKCFGCGNGGNLISFVKNIEKISYFDAAKKIAQKFNLKVSFSKNFKYSENEVLYKINLLAKDFFVENYKKNPEIINRYLKERNIQQAMAEKFEFGYALNSETALYSYLKKENIKNKLLERSGLFTNYMGKYKDRFIQRLIFPIESIGGNIVGFGGRALERAKTKYINSPSTPIYTKGEHLYGFNKTKYEISRLDSVIITEGYLDFLRLYEKGFKNSIATLGTAFTGEQLKNISRYTQNFYLLFDGDRAGMDASIKAASEIISSGFSCKIVSLPSGKDPDSYLSSHSNKEFSELIKASKELPEFLKDNNLFSTKTKIQELIKIINNISSDIQKEIFINNVAEVFNLSPFSLRVETANAQSSKKREYEKYSKTILETFRQDEISYLNIVLLDISKYKNEIISFDSKYFTSDFLRLFFDTIVGKVKQGILSFNSLLSDLEVDNNKLSSFLTSIGLFNFPTKDIEIAKNNMILRKMTKDLDLLSKEIIKSDNNKKLIKKKNEMKKAIASIGGKTIRKTLY